MLGVLNLIDVVWLYGGFEKIIMDIINGGCYGKMLAFKDILSLEKIYVLFSYIFSLSN